MSTNNRKLSRLTKDTLAALGEWFRTQYVTHRSLVDRGSESREYVLNASWDGGEQFGIEREPIWPKIARICIVQQREPSEWLRQVFFSGNEPTTQPDFFLCDHALKHYPKHDDRIADLQLKYEGLNRSAQQNCFYAEQMGAVGKAARLHGPRDRYPPLFWYCLLARESESCSAWMPKALAEFLPARDAYRKAWPHDLIPQAFLDASEDVRQRVIQQHHDG